jgi:hypothetical protein
MTDFWPACGWRHLRADAQGRLPASPAWLAGWLDRPELALVADSCVAEIALHQALRGDPLRPVPAAELAALVDDDARENYRLFIALRDGVVAAGTLEAFYCGLFGHGAITLPPLFIDLVVQTILRQLLDADATALDARAAELLYRPSASRCRTAACWRPTAPPSTGSAMAAASARWAGCWPRRKCRCARRSCRC